MAFFTIPPSGGFRDRMVPLPTDCRLIILSYFHREGSAMSKRDGWKAYFGLWADSLRRRRPAKAEIASRPVRLEMLEPRRVLALSADAGGPSEFEEHPTYVMVEGQDLVLNGSSTGGVANFTYDWNLDHNLDDCNPFDALGQFVVDCDPNFAAEVSSVSSLPTVTQTVLWAQLNAVGIDDGVFTPTVPHNPIVSLRVTDSAVPAAATALDSADLRIENVQPFFLDNDLQFQIDSGDCGGSGVTVNTKFTDPNPTEDFQVFVNWDWDQLTELNADELDHTLSGPAPAGINPFFPDLGGHNYFFNATGSHALTPRAEPYLVAIRAVADPVYGVDEFNQPIFLFYGEDQLQTRQISVSDPGTEFNLVSPAIGTYAWSVTKDGTPFTLPVGTVTDEETFNFTPEVSGVYVVSLTVTSEEGDLTDPAIKTIIVPGGGEAGPPTATINEDPLTGAEGTSIHLTSTVTHPCAPGVDYAWSVKKDGNPYPLPLDVITNAPTFTFNPADNGSFVVKVTVTDDGGSDEATATIAVANVNPTVGPLSASQAAAVGCSLTDVTLNGSFTDPGILDTFTVNVDWGDGPAAALPAGNITLVSPGHYTFTATHHYATTGSKSISVSVADNYGGPGAAPGTGSTTASVAIGAAATACLDTSTNTLVVTATSGSDWVHINAPSGSIRIQSNFLSGPLDFPAGGVTNVVILLGGGDDVLTVAGNVTLNILAVGGDGVDVMTGGRGRNVLIGGDGADTLYGGRGEDVLIDSSTIYDANELALMAILNEWASSLDVNQRIAHLSNQIGGANQVAGIYFFLNGSSIIDDGDFDVLLGNQSTDWLLLHTAIEAIGGNQDVITDL
jgi:PKD repeat protein